MDTIDPTATPPATRTNEEPDTRSKLSHILADEPSAEQPSKPQDAPSTPGAASTSALQASGQPPLQPRVKEEITVATPGMPGSTPTSTPAAGDKPMYTATTTTTRRNANGSVSSVYSGNKIRHLKKEDGVPLWRKDIQFDFLKYVFEDEKKVFHKVSDKSYGHTFADIYLDAMAKSSKCSKILKDKLLTERPAALNMAMVCLLVNVGRMNTTLNFFPEMRAQLRTYHSIPCLQARQDPNAYKQLQDAPRLKSILKGATEDIEQPSTLEDIRSASIPRTNPVNLIFVLAQYAPKISEMHFDVPRDFFDLVMKSGLSSRSRATAFLWLMWWYLESDFSSKDALENPYGPGRRSRDADDREMPIKTPQFEYLTDEQAALENVDTTEEVEFGELKRKERVAILATDMAPVITGPKRSSKKAAYNQGVGVFSMASDNDAASPARDYNSPAPSQGRGRTVRPLQAAGSIKDDMYDTDRTRSVSPTGSHTLPLPPKSAAPGGMRINTLLNDEAPTPPPTVVAPAPAPVSTPAPSKGPGRGNWGHRRKEKEAAAFAASTNAPSASRSSARAPAQASEEPDFSGAGSSSIGSRPHGFYIPLNGQLVEPKRTRPLTSHQLAVEKYRKERVDFILDRGLRTAHVGARKRRAKEGTMVRAWRRCRALPDGWDSEEEGANAGGAEAAMLGKEGVAARALLMMASLRPTTWEKSDWGEEAAGLASGMRKVRRRTERWESGASVVRRRDLASPPRLMGMESTGEGEHDEGDEGGDEAGAEGMDVDGEGENDVDADVDRSSLPPMDDEGYGEEMDEGEDGDGEGMMDEDEEFSGEQKGMIAA